MKTRAIWIGAAWLWVTSLAPSAWATPPEATTPNLLLITIDTLRRDHCSVYGYVHDTTPQLRDIAERGARFDLAYAPAPSTAPTHASILTGLYPPSHRLIRNGMELAASNRTLAEILAARGYQTAAIVSSFVLDAQFGFDQGFAHYDDEFEASESAARLDTWEGHAVAAGFDRPANAATRRAMRWLWEGRDPQRPFFLFVHYFDPHAPYRAPPPYDRRFPFPGPDPGAGPPGSLALGEALRNYDGEIAFTDHEIGRLLEALERLGLAEHTLLVVTADHGEGLMDHGHMAHGLSLHEELLRVPLLLRWPGKIPPGRSYAEPVELVDIAPTVIELLDASAGTSTANQLQASRFQGRSLAAWLLGKDSPEAKPPVRPVFLFRRHFAADFVEGIRVKGALSGIRLGKWKLIEATEPPRRELYDLESDPGERVNRLHDEPDVAARLGDALAEHGRGQPAAGSALRLPNRVRRALEALGYAD